MAERGLLRLAIIADDLTGALDSAAPFAARGAAVQVALAPAAIASALAANPEVIAISTDSREIAAGAAQHAVTAALAALPAGTPIFKKVDSRLKGHIATELGAVGFRRALVAPAIPEFGRIAQGGFLRGFGVDVPIDIAACLGAHADRAEIPDTETPDQMADALAASSADLLIGARGLAEALAARLFPAPPQPVLSLPGPRALFVIGSRDPITTAQVAALTGAGVALLPAPNGVAGVSDAGMLAVQAVPGRDAVAPQAVSGALARAVVPDLIAGRQTLLLTGGATAAAVLDRMGVTLLRLRGECLPGLPVAEAGGFTIVAKSGGFGDADSLLRVCRRIDTGT